MKKINEILFFIPIFMIIFILINSMLYIAIGLYSKEMKMIISFVNQYSDFFPNIPILNKSHFIISTSIAFILSIFVGKLIPTKNAHKNWEGGRIHKTRSGDIVRSKSEVIIANALTEAGIKFEYETPLYAKNGKSKRSPDFLFRKGNRIILLEHLGMLNNYKYKQAWERKINWYAKNGYILGENLFTTRDIQGSIDMNEVDGVIKLIKNKLGIR